MTYDKHHDACLCLICARAQSNSVYGLACKILRAVLREWDADALGDLPSDTILAGLSWTAGFFAAMRHYDKIAAFAIFEKGYSHALDKKPDAPRTIEPEIATRAQIEQMMRQQKKE